jgi:hypothetical protein
MMKIECDLCLGGAILIIGLTAVVTWYFVATDCPKDLPKPPLNFTRPSDYFEVNEEEDTDDYQRDPIGEDQDLRPLYKYCNFCQLYKSPTAIFHINDIVRNATKNCIQLSCAENRTSNGGLQYIPHIHSP